MVFCIRGAPLVVVVCVLVGLVCPLPTTPDSEPMFGELKAPATIEPGLPRHPVNDDDGMKYLMRFGYIGENSEDPRTSNIKDPGAVKEALRKFQRMAGVPQTGIMDAATKEMMSLPRCGLKDAAKSKRMKRYALQGSKWDDVGLTYRINSFTEDLPKATVKAIFSRAFKAWSDVSPLTFTKKESGSVDIEIEFGEGDHGDPDGGEPFDGPGKTLAHAFFPVYGGDAHFDDAEDFTDGKHKGINLFQVAVHEFGHSLGLSHSDDKNALMYAIYRGYLPNFKLHQDDVDAIQTLYGKTQITTPASTKKGVLPGAITSPNPFSTTMASPTGACNERFDAIVSLRIPSSKTDIIMAFSGEDYYIRSGKKVFKRNIKEDFSRTDRVNAAIATSKRTEAKLFLFQGKKIHEFTVTANGADIRIRSRKSMLIRSFIHGLPDDIDAIFRWSGNNKIYAFKGSQYYQVAGNRVPSRYPRSIDIWGLPATITHVDTIMQHNHHTYFFIGQDYYRHNDRQLTVAQGYPRNIGQDWLGCRTGGMRVESTESSDQMNRNDGITRVKTAYQNEQASSTSDVSSSRVVIVTNVVVMILVNSGLLK